MLWESSVLDPMEVCTFLFNKIYRVYILRL